MTTNQLCEPGRSHTLPGIQSPLLQEGQRQLDSRPTGSSALEFYQGRASSPPLPSGEQFQHLRTARETPEGLVLPHLVLCGFSRAPSNIQLWPDQRACRWSALHTAPQLAELCHPLCPSLDVSFPVAFLS